MLFSVLVAQYNNARFLKQSLQSVYDQTYTNWEIIIVNDGSTDNFEEVIGEFLDDSRIKIFNNPQNMGCSFTKHICAEKANGDILGFLDPDDTLMPDALQIMVEAHLQKPQCSMIYSTHYICNEHLENKIPAGYQRALPFNTPYLLLGDGSIHHFVSFKKLCYGRTNRLLPVREYDGATDQDLYYLLEEVGDVFFINKILYNYRIHGGGISTLKNVYKAQTDHYLVIERACLRRVEKLKMMKDTTALYWIKTYKLRYCKIRILNSWRRGQWGPLISSLLIYPFVGGLDNMISYSTRKMGSVVLYAKKSSVSAFCIFLLNEF